jgi:hypothetical protein
MNNKFFDNPAAIEKNTCAGSFAVLSWSPGN